MEDEGQGQIERGVALQNAVVAAMMTSAMVMVGGEWWQGS